MRYCVQNPALVLLAIPLIIILIIIIKKTFVTFKNDEEKKAFKKAKRGDRRFLLLTRAIMIFLLLIALSSIHTEKSITVPGDVSLLILGDNSTSFNLFEKGVAQDLAGRLKGKLPVNLRYIASAEKSAIGDGILNNMKGDDNILVVTDGNNNHGRVLGDVILFASGLNTSVSMVDLKPIKDDAGVKILGPNQVVVGEKNTFIVDVNEVGSVDSYLLEVKLDGKKIISEKNTRRQEFTESFSEGYHRIEARLEVDDYFSENDVYYKTVKVIPKPKVLFVSESSSPLVSGLSSMYELTKEEELPDDISAYHTVVLNNIKGDKAASWVKELTDYVTDGNGLVVIGGDSAYDKGYYQIPSYMIETLLPVRVGIPEKEGKTDANIVILIDISGTAGLSFKGSSGSSKLDVQKALTLGVLSTIRPDDRVALVAFNDVSHLISPLTTLGEKEDELVQKIKTLKAGGGTLVFQGLRRSEFLLEGMEGGKNVIVISDGLDAAPKAALDLTKVLVKKGVNVFTVGIGEGTNENFLKSMADVGKGLYLEPEETENLRLLFGETPSGEGESFGLVILDKNHWISKGDISLSATLTGFNYVVPKSGARTIVATASGNPVITAGSFGLGRVVSISTDDGSKWAGEMLRKENSKVITRSINYAIGDPGRNLDFDVSVEDTPINKPAQIRLISDKLPKSDLAFSKIGDRLYVATFAPEKIGFTDILGATVAVNYNDEYLDVGMNSELKELVTLTGGKVFDKDDIDGIVSTIRTVSKRVKVETVNYRWPFVIAALLLLLLEIIVRRIRENTRR